MVDVGVLLNQQAYDLSPQELIDLARRVEALGVESAWLLDPFSRDPFLTAAFILANTSKLKVGTGIATVYSRDPMAAVQARDSFSHYYPGRFLMGLGASNPVIAQMRGGVWTPPVPKMSAYLEAMATTKLAHAPSAEPVPLHIAAHAPGLQNLAMKYASGIITWILPVESIRTARAYVGPDLEITANFPCVLNADEEEARRIARDFLADYLKIDYYRAAYSKLGFTIDDFENGGSDSLIDAIAALGDAKKIKARVDEYVAAGATRVVLNPIRAAGDAATGLEFNARPDIDSLDELIPLLR